MTSTYYIYNIHIFSWPLEMINLNDLLEKPILMIEMLEHLKS